MKTNDEVKISMRTQSLIGPKIVMGWVILHQPTKPITSKWQAERNGVTMCAGTYDALVSMINTRHYYAAYKLGNEIEISRSMLREVIALILRIEIGFRKSHGCVDLRVSIGL